MSAISDNPVAPSAIRRLMPGTLVCVTVALASAFVSDHHGGPTLLYALLIGMAFHFLSTEGKTAEGIAFSAKSVLRLGVALLGARISVGQIAELGLLPVAVAVGGVTATLGFGLLAGRLLGLGRAQSVLTAGSVGICGASAAMAIAAVLPRGKGVERDTIFTIIAVTTLSTAAMIVYPLVIKALALDDRAAGIFLGGSIHDVAQVVGAGYLVSDTAGIVATFVKLMRVAMLVPVVVVVGWAFSAAASSFGERRTPSLPSFLIGFIALACANSLSLIPAVAVDIMAETSRWCLVTAIAALGMKTALKEILQVGWRPIALIVAETLFLATLVLSILWFDAL